MTQMNPCTPIFIAALFTIAKTRKQNKCPLTEEWIKKMWCVLCVVSCSAMSDSLRPHGLQPCQAPLSMGFLGKNTGMGYHALLQGIFPTQGSNPGLLHYGQILYPLSHQGSPKKMWYIYTMEYYSDIKKNEIMSFAGTWMGLRSTILSEVRQTEKEKYHMISLRCRI